MMGNLLKETLTKLKIYDKSWEDVKFVLCQDVTFTPEQAKPMLDFYYDNGYGGQEVDDSLMIVGDDWWLERHEYDGSEWWEFKRIPKETDKKYYLPKTFQVDDIWYRFKTFRDHHLWTDPENYDDYIYSKTVRKE